MERLVWSRGRGATLGVRGSFAAGVKHVGDTPGDAPGRATVASRGDWRADGGLGAVSRGLNGYSHAVVD